MLLFSCLKFELRVFLNDYELLRKNKNATISDDICNVVLFICLSK